MTGWWPCLVREVTDGELRALRLGHPLVDDYLAFVAARARRNTWLAHVFDLKVFFTVVAKDPAAVSAADVFAFVEAQRRPRRGGNLVRLEDGERGLSARTIRRRLSTVSSFYAYLVARGDNGVDANPVPRGMATRRASTGPGGRPAPLIRAPRTLPRILEPAEVDALVAAMRTRRDRAMVEAMVLGGLRRCEVLGSRFEDLNVASRRVFVTDGKGGHQRSVPVSGRFFATVADYLELERPRTSSTDRIFVVLKGPQRGRGLSAAGLDQILRDACRRARLRRITCHQLRHTCLTRLREAGMALEAVQAQAGHQSIESTRIYLHLADSWLAGEYRRAIEAIDSELPAVVEPTR